MRRRFSVAVLVACVCALLGSGTALAVPSGGVQEQVVVVLHDDVDARGAARDAAREHRAAVSFVYENALRGFAASVPAGRLNGLRRDPRVDYVEPDRVRTIQEQTVPTGVDRTFAATNANIGIDGSDDSRIDVDVAVLDTGIDLQHPDLDVAGSVDCFYTDGGGPPWTRRTTCGPGGDDDHYHGTHVAGTVGALDNDFGAVGVAPGARLWAVKVLNSSGSGSVSNVVAGVDWVAANAGDIEVANMSLGGAGSSQAEYDAIQGAVNNGVAFAVAAGNDDADARGYSPSAFDNVLTVSALADFDGEPGGNGTPTCRADQDDTLADFSNWGPAVQIAAPGVCIFSTYPIERGSYGVISGTSMASPHAAGALAMLASSANPNNASDVEALYAQIIAAGNFDWTDDSGDTIQEPLLDVSNTTLFDPALIAGSGGGDDGGGDTPPPSPSLSATGRKVKGVKHVDLSWHGATSTNVDVHRDGRLITTTANDGAHTDNIGERGGGSYTYTVCEAGTPTCSNEATVSF